MSAPDEFEAAFAEGETPKPESAATALIAQHEESVAATSAEFAQAFEATPDEKVDQ
jgi:hypothetical protein